MSDETTHVRLLAPVSSELIVKKSVFRAFAAPISSEEEAMAVVAEHAQTDASHCCWAWRISPRARMCDAGEPSGTAGRPILTAIEGQRFEHVIVVVLRWFGGVKLGAGGLIRAYGAAAAQALRLGRAAPWVKKTEMRCHVPFSLFPIIQSRMMAWGADALAHHFEQDGVTICIAVPDRQLDTVRQAISDLARGQVEFSYSET